MPQNAFVRTALAVLVLLAVAVSPALPQRPPGSRPFQVHLDLGYINLFSYPKWIDLGAGLEIRLGRSFLIDPDVSLWIGESFTRKVRVVPGLTGNIRLGRIVIGGGAVYRVPEWPDEPVNPESHGWLMPKAQIGYGAGPARLTFALYFPGGVHKVAAGLTIAMGIGLPSRD